MPSPRQAYTRAKIEGPSKDTRKAVLSSAQHSYYYAKYIDKFPRDDTRKAVLSSAYYSCCYARYIDKGPRDDTRKAVLSSPLHSYYYALRVDKSPRDDTRNAVLSNTKRSFEYAAYVDEIIFISNYELYFVDIHNIGMRCIRENKFNIGFISVGCLCLDVL